MKTRNTDIHSPSCAATPLTRVGPGHPVWPKRFQVLSVLELPDLEFSAVDDVNNVVDSDAEESELLVKVKRILPQLVSHSKTFFA